MQVQSKSQPWHSVIWWWNMPVQYGKVSACTQSGPQLNKACREITGCLKASKVEDLYSLAGITPPDIRRKVYASVEKKKRESNEAYSLFGQKSAKRRLQSQNSFVLRMIYINKKIHLNVPTTPATCGGTGSSVKRYENWSHPIPSISVGRQTTTNCFLSSVHPAEFPAKVVRCS